MTWRHGWVCKDCSFANDSPTESVCEICRQPAPGVNLCNDTLKPVNISTNASRFDSVLSRESKNETAAIEVISLDSDESNQNRCDLDPVMTEVHHWTCPDCTFTNTSDHSYCHVCNRSRINSTDSSRIRTTFGSSQVNRHESKNGLKHPDLEVIEIELSDDDKPDVTPRHIADLTRSLHNENVMEKKSPRKRKGRRSASETNSMPNKDAKKKIALNKTRLLGTFFWSEILVHIPDAVFKKYSPFIKEALEVLHGEIDAFRVNDRKHWITWERRVIDSDLEPDCFDKANNRLILNEQCPVSSSPVSFSALFYEAADFVDEYESGQVLARINSALQSPESRVALIVFDLRRVVRLIANKAMRKQLSQTSTTAAQITNRKTLSSVGQIDEFAAHLINQYSCRCSFLNFSNLSEVGMFLAQTTRHIALEPYKPDATSTLGFRYQNVMKSAVVGGIFTPSMKEWFNVLIRIPGVSAKRAEGIIKRYPSCAALLFAYSSCRTDDERKRMLEEIEVEERKLGPSVSATVFDYLYSS